MTQLIPDDWTRIVDYGGGQASAIQLNQDPYAESVTARRRQEEEFAHRNGYRVPQTEGQWRERLISEFRQLEDKLRENDKHTRELENRLSIIEGSLISKSDRRRQRNPKKKESNGNNQQVNQPANPHQPDEQNEQIYNF